ncbi:ABC transporter ATP-binding protein [Bifidobacterium choloepi]|uniref:ATP-binding cassette domain-containing protein n=1 Tax=Bifidobacterium choloepi TaxID=2614131 RepID=A0A6I5ND30_9BIFI|nr:ATP-binding cassette domain-containing protein [Bifidobacterium choloepi]NEG69364.1 ATP-binding cassette domain-containing protein [Bifidobacterium choloepi]
MDAIAIEGLTKTYRGIPAVDNLTMHVPRGSIYGFIGENGSGKSTTEKLICGLLTKQGGRVSILGRPGDDPLVRSRLGVLIENPGCFPDSTVYRNLFMQALNLGLPNPDKEIRRVLSLVGMESAAGQKFGKCSLGMKQRIGVAQALMGHPDVLVLDEPINGLDADGIRTIRETLLHLAHDEGVTVLITSHVLGELSKIATHYGIIRRGHMIKEMTAAELETECQSFVYVATEDDWRAAQVLARRWRRVEVLDGDGQPIHVKSSTGSPTGGLRVYDALDSEDVSRYLFEHGLFVREIRMNRIGLEEYYLQLMDEQRHGPGARMNRAAYYGPNEDGR